MQGKMWTLNQKNAIDLRDGTVMVSAGAGSGKTAVLVQRIVERITDNKKPCSADRLLVATFTNAAAAEMRERISSRISEMIEKTPSNVCLQRQQLLLKRARISTIDSFCNDIVRENFYKLGISPNFRISDNNETLLLRENAMKNVMDKLYEESSESFLNLVELFSSDRDDMKLVEMVEQIYNFMRAYPFPSKWISNSISLYKDTDNVFDMPWGKVMITYLKEALSYLIGITKNSINICYEDEKILNAYLEALNSDMINLNLVINAVNERNWDMIISTIEKFDYAKFKPLKGYNEDMLKVKIKNNREYVKTNIKKLKKFFFIKESRIKQDNRKIRAIVIELFRIVELFGEEFATLKANKNVADFSDLEHWMIKLLVCEQNDKYVKSEVAVELSEQFDEIMVDECQDINETQNMIFKMLSKDEKNLFMVGDVKQSIYGFRQAMPEIFLKRKEKCMEFCEGNIKYPLKVVLDKNFRSRKGIIDTVNFIFKQLMSKGLGEMDYTDEETLKYGANYPLREEDDTEVHIIETQGNEEESSNVLEAREIARIISKMVSEGHEVHDGNGTHKVTYRDFCILLRSANKHAPEYAKELYNCGVPSWCDANGKFFGTIEVSVMISFLRVIDNPIQDIPLISLLVSPIYGFTPDDLAKIRINNRDLPIYFALKEYEKTGDKRCRKFLGDLDEYRSLAVMMRPNKLINYIYDNTGYPAIVQAMENGELRLANLRMLVEYAAKYEGEVYKGLSGFIRFIDKLQEQKSDLTPASAISETANVVRIMSIHRSKGLEFPVCILAGCSRKFNKDIGDVIIHNKLGLGIKLRNDSNTVQYHTMVRQAILFELEREGLSEELRVLYVALTRAREKLIMMITVKNLENTVSKLLLNDMDDIKISPYMLRNMNSFGEWILCSALRHPSAYVLKRYMPLAEHTIIKDNVTSWKIAVKTTSTYETTVIQNDVVQKERINKDILQLITKRFNYTYPYENLEKLPVKVAASQVSHGDDWSKYVATSRPAFLFKSSLTSSESGTAIHQFMQFANYKKSLNDFDAEVLYLIEKGFLSKEQAKAINREYIYRFLNSSLGSRIMKSRDLIREYRFSVRVPVEEYNPKCKGIGTDDKVILQGAIDCVFEEDGQYVIVDYKTDKINKSVELIEKYSNQLKIYKYAFEKCKGYKVKDCIIYSFSLGIQESI